MTGLLKCAFFLGMFFFVPILLRWLLNRELTRNHFSLFVSTSMAVIFFLISIMYGDKHPIIIGLLMVLFAIAGGYPTAYLGYPILMKRIPHKIS